MQAVETSSTVPFHIELRQLYRNPDEFEHELGFGPVGISEPAFVIISSDLYSDPKIVERVKRGVVELPDRILDRLAIQCFRLMASAIREHGGDSGWRTLADCTKWLQCAFHPEVAEQVICEFSRHVPPGLSVTSACLLADDDAI